MSQSPVTANSPSFSEGTPRQSSSLFFPIFILVVGAFFLLFCYFLFCFCFCFCFNFCFCFCVGFFAACIFLVVLSALVHLAVFPSGTQVQKQKLRYGHEENVNRAPRCTVLWC
mmetsp:Transcript_8512/g.21490  ORF Transcript_8512/g.21490 Transcript_8512/m.21490 type:complete len:113 (+) Transcript_8512:67-405(+)